MSDLLIRGLDGRLKQRLREQAAAHGVSMVEEARRILRAGLAPRAENPATLAHALFGPNHGVELDLPERGDDRPVPDFGA